MEGVVAPAAEAVSPLRIWLWAIAPGATGTSRKTATRQHQVGFILPSKQHAFIRAQRSHIRTVPEPQIVIASKSVFSGVGSKSVRDWQFPKQQLRAERMLWPEPATTLERVEKVTLASAFANAK